MTGSPPTLVFPWTAEEDLGFLLSREWLVTNGLGGYASGTLLGISTRRYHGLFVPNLPAPRGRTMVIPRVDEEVTCGTHKVLLGGAEFADGHIEGAGHLFLREFRLESVIPTWTFEIPSGKEAVSAASGRAGAKGKEAVSAASESRDERARLGELGGGVGVMAGAKGKEAVLAASESREERARLGELEGGAGATGEGRALARPGGAGATGEGRVLARPGRAGAMAGANKKEAVLAASANHVLEKRIVMPHTLNTAYIEYRLVSGGPIHLTLRPFVTFRMHDGPLGVPSDYPFTLAATRGRLEVHPFEGAPPMRLCMRPQRGVFVVQEQISPNVYYRVERERGYDHLEDLVSPGYFSVDLAVGESLSLVVSTEGWELLDPSADRILEAERGRLEKVLAAAPKEAQSGPAAHLVLAADQFLILPGSRPEESVLASISGEEIRTIIAGYHWFTDWGRDTMISLEGLTLCTGRPREARAILRTFAHYVKDGLLPNHFPEGQRTAIYNTADATLWYFHALDRYYEHTGDRETLQLLFPVLKSVIEHHLKGTHFGIGVDPADGLLKAGAEGYALTWMDAKVEGWVVTPRRGKPVEIQALWYNALRLMSLWAEELRDGADEYKTVADTVERNFNARFWYEGGRYLYDLIDGDQGDDTSLRPNQIFSISLRFPVLAQSLWQPVLDTVAVKLLTPVGLRTLDPGHRDYKPNYFGDLRARDAAYHQGTVWGWLIGHFVDAWLKIYPDKERARGMLGGLQEELRDAGIGTISEIFDADPRYTPRGCIAQAWSVAEVLRAFVVTQNGHHLLERPSIRS